MSRQDYSHKARQKEPMKLHIEYPDDMDAVTALECVKKVAAVGRVSENSNGKHFCWVTLMHDEFWRNIQVATRPKKKGQTADSFIISYTD